MRPPSGDTTSNKTAVAFLDRWIISIILNPRWTQFINAINAAAMEITFNCVRTKRTRVKRVFRENVIWCRTAGNAITNDAIHNALKYFTHFIWRTVEVFLKICLKWIRGLAQKLPSMERYPQLSLIGLRSFGARDCRALDSLLCPPCWFYRQYHFCNMHLWELHHSNDIIRCNVEYNGRNLTQPDTSNKHFQNCHDNEIIMWAFFLSQKKYLSSNA